MCLIILSDKSLRFQIFLGIAVKKMSHGAAEGEGNGTADSDGGCTLISAVGRIAMATSQ